MKKTIRLSALLLALCACLGGCTMAFAERADKLPAAAAESQPEVTAALEKLSAEEDGNDVEYAETNYLEEMMECCAAKDMESGWTACSLRNEKIDRLGLEEKKIGFDELYELSMVITSEAGSAWLPMDWKMMVGEVVLNRVASPEFPDTVYEVVHQAGQYYGANGSRFQKLFPGEECVEAAVRLLSGERVINDPSVVFQSNSKQGSGVYMTRYDETLGYTYFCHSSHLEYYEPLKGGEDK